MVAFLKPKRNHNMESLEGVKTKRFCKAVECQGHQVLFSFERGFGKFTKIAEMYVPGVGRVAYKTTVEGGTADEADRWLDGVDIEVAYKTLVWLKGFMEKTKLKDMDNG